MINSLMGFYRVLWILKSLGNCFVWNHQYYEKFAPPPPHWEFYHRFMYLAPSSDCSLLTLSLPFKVILRRFEVVFWCLEWECCIFQEIDENSFKSTYTILQFNSTLSWMYHYPLIRLLLEYDVTRRDPFSVVMDAGSRIVNLIRDGTVFA